MGKDGVRYQKVAKFLGEHGYFLARVGLKIQRLDDVGNCCFTGGFTGGSRDWRCCEQHRAHLELTDADRWEISGIVFHQGRRIDADVF